MLANLGLHQRHLLTVSATIAPLPSFKVLPILMVLHALIGPNAVQVKKARPPVPLQTAVVRIVKRLNIKPIQLTRERLVPTGPPVLLEKKVPLRLCLLIAFVPIVKRVNFKPRVHRPRILVLVALLEKVT